MMPSVAPYSAIERRSWRAIGVRQGRQNSSMSVAEKPSRSAVVPCAPTSGKRAFLAHDVPVHKNTMEPKMASMGNK